MDAEMKREMTIEQVYWFIDLFDELEIRVWLDGGWGVDALLGEQTREHGDLDIMVPSSDSGHLVDALRTHGFVDVHTDDRVDENFVLGHEGFGLIDFHVFEFADNGDGIYRPGVYDWVITAAELDACGQVGDRRVRCLSAEYQVRSHSGYPLQLTDLQDMAALRGRFGVELLAEQVHAIEQAGL